MPIVHPRSATHRRSVCRVSSPTPVTTCRWPPAIPRSNSKTGSGYHQAVTAEIVGAEHVSTVEIDADFAEMARERLAQLGYAGVSIRVGDGRTGWLDLAPFDKVYLTCADRASPTPLIEQTRIGGLLLGPIGLADQRLVLATKRTPGRSTDSIVVPWNSSRCKDRMGKSVHSICLAHM